MNGDNYSSAQPKRIRREFLLQRNYFPSSSFLPPYQKDSAMPFSSTSPVVDDVHEIALRQLISHFNQVLLIVPQINCTTDTVLLVGLYHLLRFWRVTHPGDIIWTHHEDINFQLSLEVHVIHGLSFQKNGCTWPPVTCVNTPKLTLPHGLLSSYSPLPWPFMSPFGVSLKPLCSQDT